MPKRYKVRAKLIERMNSKERATERELVEIKIERYKNIFELLALGQLNWSERGVDDANIEYALLLEKREKLKDV